MGLVKEAIGIPDFGQGVGTAEVVEHGVEPDNGGKLFGRGAYPLAETFFKGTLAQAECLAECLDGQCTLALADEPDCFVDGFVGGEVAEVTHPKLLHCPDALGIGDTQGKLFFDLCHAAFVEHLIKGKALVKQRMGRKGSKVRKAGFGKIHQYGANARRIPESFVTVGNAGNACRGQPGFVGVVEQRKPTLVLKPCHQSTRGQHRVFAAGVVFRHHQRADVGPEPSGRKVGVKFHCLGESALGFFAIRV